MSFAGLPRVIPREDLFEPSPPQSTWSLKELEEELQEWYSSFALYDDFPSDYIFESDASTSDSSHSDHPDSDESNKSEDLDGDLAVNTEREELWKRKHPPSLRDLPSEQYRSPFRNGSSHTAVEKRRFASLAKIVDAHTDKALDSFANSSVLSSEPRLIVHYSRLPSSPMKHQPISPSPLRRELRLFKRRPVASPSSSSIMSSEPKLVAHYSPLSNTPMKHQATSPSPLRQELCLFYPPPVTEGDEVDPIEEGWM